ncbi:flagellar hook-basal body complex protein FliE [Mariprofundus sp. NF]|uniref:flagellar hook-basal body complex protein FliE n=1 Tax=Mariprofundus sp. NF TaxID=2608716 RepID=UPI0015A17685|nr:flagellar hook-basal body complex protein FliE [Mariprofundus sp. NF]NWF37686.1 flagellar hook-basal body complex protein FliE [Mariprofundus sp. NF]
MSIQGIGPTTGLTGSNSLQVGDRSTAGKADNFGEMLKAYTEQMNHDKKAAASASVALATGESVNTSETLMAIQKADLSFQMMLGVRNKLVDAYREIIRMQV